MRASLPRPVAVSKSGPAWGPLTPAGFWAMHGGDLFYCILGLLVWKFAWPGDSEAAEWPTSAAAFHTDFGGAVTAWASSWVGRVVFRNLIINITIYELWHQVKAPAQSSTVANGRAMTSETACACVPIDSDSAFGSCDGGALAMFARPPQFTSFVYARHVGPFWRTHNRWHSVAALQQGGSVRRWRQGQIGKRKGHDLLRFPVVNCV